MHWETYFLQNGDLIVDSQVGSYFRRVVKIVKWLSSDSSATFKNRYHV